ncbi:hypothetical protein TNCV_4863311 [Trichonephila clavipes]|nr:hypothetical protein TNCV_4863311 [Trichonephila clavipes]
MFWKILLGSLVVDVAKRIVSTDPAGNRHLRFVFRGSWVNSHSKEELVKMLIVYGYTYCNGHTSRWLYEERYPGVFHNTRTLPKEDLIARKSDRRIRDMLKIFQNVGVCMREKNVGFSSHEKTFLVLVFGITSLIVVLSIASQGHLKAWANWARVQGLTLGGGPRFVLDSVIIRS